MRVAGFGIRDTGYEMLEVDLGSRIPDHESRISHLESHIPNRISLIPYLASRISYPHLSFRLLKSSRRRH